MTSSQGRARERPIQTLTLRCGCGSVRWSTSAYLLCVEKDTPPIPRRDRQLLTGRRVCCTKNLADMVRDHSNFSVIKANLML